MNPYVVADENKKTGGSKISSSFLSSYSHGCSHLTCNAKKKKAQMIVFIFF
jgi:hypothetical protein